MAVWCLYAETCWALNEYWIFKKISGIKLVSLYSTIKMMHSPINIRNTFCVQWFGFENLTVYEITLKTFCIAGQNTDDNMAHEHCMLDGYKYTNSGCVIDSSWNVMAHGGAREGKWRGNCRMQWIASTLHTTSEQCVSSITTADAHTSAASSRLNWRQTADLNGLVRFARKTKSGFARVIKFQLHCTHFFSL